MIRLPLAAAVVLVAVLVVPEALRPGVNSADLILAAAPFALLAVGWPRRSRRVGARLVELPPRGQRGEVVPRPPHASDRSGS